jgi:hypothetical protein
MAELLEAWCFKHAEKFIFLFFYFWLGLLLCKLLCNGLWWYKLCSTIFFELLPGNFSIEWPIVEFNVPESWSLSIISHISFNESYPDCVAQVTPNQQLDQAILDQGLQEVEQLSDGAWS